jgi:hypothetical protein
MHTILDTSWLPSPSPAKTLHPDIVLIDVAHTAASEQSKARMSRGESADILI